MSARPASMNKPQRRKQADRRADTRRRIIDATIRCLYRLGYSSTTFALVAEAADVSRGIISYHFLTKADLMVAVRDAVYLEERRQVDEVRAKLGTEKYLQELPRIVMAGMRREPAIAVNEILLAARADPELSAKLRQEEQEIERHTLASQRDNYAELGVAPPANLAVMSRVAVATFRGLAIAELVQGEDAEIDACVEYVIQLFEKARAPAPSSAS
ncbi:TetR/AcrR family transcriptional regulator [Sphingomonas sp. MG17]|uniref:TetR/AcrR family transcriptional regulator n=1 Tax=Sphingomonas tagetis TaxID=2949092 RepID=A0A9X2HRL7_9SPHN|nr:TetR/AcrR family transcriptional regulator [Sphingomonas tagetis]MCP3732243.1 TetR/AcrR family transcriptional regulator [Sphingomonas tagetis]